MSDADRRIEDALRSSKPPAPESVRGGVRALGEPRRVQRGPLRRALLVATPVAAVAAAVIAVAIMATQDDASHPARVARQPARTLSLEQARAACAERAARALRLDLYVDDVARSVRRAKAVVRSHGGAIQLARVQPRSGNVVASFPANSRAAVDELRRIGLLRVEEGPQLRGAECQSVDVVFVRR